MRFSKRQLAEWLEVGALVGLGGLVLQRLALGAHLQGAGAGDSGPGPTGYASFSILKPLCGVDDGLAESLAQFARLSYPRFELLLGVEGKSDPAFAVAQQVRSRWPGRVRVVVKGADVGLNPKVNQLAGLARAARGDILLISDSNTRPARGYLEELNRLFADPRVGCVTNPVAGAGAKTLGARLDGLHLAGVAGQVALGAAVGVPLSVGKSQAVRRSALARLGGFEAYSSVLAEDYLIGRDVQRAGWRTLVARTPVYNWNEKKSVGDFQSRYARWGTMQATAEGPVPALAAGLLNPIPLALGALALGGSGVLAAGVVGLKAAMDMSAARELGMDVSLGDALAVPVKDLALAGAQFRGFFDRTVSWRGKPALAVGPGTRLTPVRGLPTRAHQRPARR